MGVLSLKEKKKVQNEMTGYPYPPVINTCTTYTMPKNYLDKAIEVVPRFRKRISVYF
jgi:hypothetical protein